MTAVKFLEEMLTISLGKHHMSLFVNEFNKAKKIEQEQIEQAYFDGTCFEENGFSNNPSQYYKVNYTKDKL